MYRNLSVLLYGEPVGELLQTDEGYTFSYRPDYQGHPLSLSLPVTGKPDFSVRLHPFFKGLAPEGWLRRRYAELQRIDEEDLLGMLVENGNDLLGAVTLRLNNHV